jgi:hypothetical protein
VPVATEHAYAVRAVDSLHSGSRDRLGDTVAQLLEYCRRHAWAGYDPYDALDSPLLMRTGLIHSKMVRLLAIQGLKRSPINLRPLLGIRGAQNPKALALFLSALIKLQRDAGIGTDIRTVDFVERLAELRSDDHRYWCWGYSFPWQTRTELVPRFAPNIVCTTFVGDALLALHEWRPDTEYLAMAVGAAEYMTQELFWRGDHGAAGFSYPSPPSHTRVHNANLLAAAFLCRVYTHHAEDSFLDAASAAARYAASAQHADGSWRYGEASTQQWIDNFHTGYNLCALDAIGRCLNTAEFDTALRRGLEFYRGHFFETDGAPKYFHDRPYPFDSHSAAQSIITLVTLRRLWPEGMALAEMVYTWTMLRLWNADGYFSYRVHRFGTNRIPYMRWSQAWMLLAIATLLGARQAESTS